jgi:hypothetical protein
MTTEYFVDEGVDGGFGPGKCLGYEKNALSVVDCRDASKGTDWELKTNGMMCMNECRECLINGAEGALEVAKCGVAKKGKMNNLKRVFGGGEYTLDERIVYFKTIPKTSSLDSGAPQFVEAPSPIAWRKCNWLENGATYLNDEWPLILRSEICNKIQGCGFEDNTGLCRVAGGASRGSDVATTPADDEVTTPAKDMCKCTGSGNEIECSQTGKRHCASDEECYGKDETLFGDWEEICAKSGANKSEKKL